MKKIVSIIIIGLLLLFPAVVWAEEETVTSFETGDRNILFSNDYRGFCLDVNLKGAYEGDSFTAVDNTSAVTNNADRSDVSQLLKIMFTYCFEDVFVSDGNGSYDIMDTNMIQAVVWHFTDNQYVWGEQSKLVDKIEAYDGPEIPDNGYELRMDNGDVISFDFMVMKPQNAEQQYFFSYKLTVGKVTHEHDFNEAWESDDENHWHECGCGEESGKAPHKGNAPDCITPSKCEECGKELAGVDPEKHTGETEVRGAKEATEFEEGYTGDIHCKDCGELLEEGEVIPAIPSEPTPPVEPEEPSEPSLPVIPAPPSTQEPEVDTETTEDTEMTEKDEETTEAEEEIESVDKEDNDYVAPDTEDNGVRHWFVVMMFSMACTCILFKKVKVK